MNATNPKCVIFFTGSNYDNDIMAKLPDAKFVEIHELEKSERSPALKARIYRITYI